ncbi:MAG: endonuclease MutS2 [Christensenellales bacterium]|jgi:DNA mismatch repair protein MutS2
MYHKTLAILEYEKILSAICTFADSSAACKKIMTQPIYKDIEVANTELDKVQEAFNLLYIKSTRPSFAVDDISPVLEKANIFSTLTIAEILKVRNTLRVARLARKTIEDNEDSAPLLCGLVMDIYTDKTLEDSINDAFLSETEFRDTASSALYAIRKAIKRISDNIRKKLNSYITSPDYKNIIQDNIVTIRNERYVIPVKLEHKASLPGLIHDQSSSKQTIFIEPLEIIELNNELKGQLIAEAEEQERILRHFTQRIAGIASMLEIAFNTLIHLDIVFSKARYAEKIGGVRPALNADYYINIADARHPLIDKEKVVPNNIILGREYNTLLITGPNTGGKTVYLKTAGLLQLMAQSGIFLPAKSAECGVFENIFCDIGDEQSIEQSLSTFSSHIVNIKTILENISPRTLVLMDELGAGTDPSEGAALAVAIAEYVIDSGARALITTHFNELKEFALGSDRIENACMDFETQTYSPTFKLLIGAPGSSNALNIAEKLGLSKEIIEKARTRQAPHKAEIERIIRELEILKKEALEAREQAAANLEHSREELRKAKSERAALTLKREKLAESWQKERKELLKDTVGEAEELLAELKEMLANPTEQALFEGRKAVKSLKDKLFTAGADDIPEAEEGEINIGDWVWVKPLKVRAQVESYNAKKEEYKVSFSGISANVKAADCAKASEGYENEKTKLAASVNQFSPATVSGTLNLIGKNTDEGVYELGLYLDKAYLAGYGEVNIIHGIGTGRLRLAVRGFLKDCAFVKEFRDGIYGEGERGVTIVKFR